MLRKMTERNHLRTRWFSVREMNTLPFYTDRTGRVG